MYLNRENDNRYGNNWLAWCVVSIFLSYLIGNFLGIFISYFMNEYALPVYPCKIVISLIPQFALVAGVMFVVALNGKYRQLLYVSRFRNWKWYYIPETVGLEFVFLAFSIVFGIGMLLFKTLFPVLYNLMKNLSNAPYLFIKEIDWGTFAIIVVGAVFIAPAVEEITFRAVMFKGLKKYTNVYAAAIITSLIFAAFHFNVIQFIPLFILGLLFQFLYISHKSIFPGIIFHTIHNGIAMSFLFLIKFYNWDIGI